MYSAIARAAVVLVLVLCPLLWAFDGYVLLIIGMTTGGDHPGVNETFRWMIAAFFVLPLVFGAACRVRRRQVLSR